jgi:hypothetical protein
MPHPSPPRPPARPWARRAALALLITLLGCAAAAAALQIHQRTVAASGMTQTICLALETSPRVRLGVVWTAPMLSYIPPLMLSPTKACIDMPFDPAPGARPWLPREWLLIP